MNLNRIMKYIPLTILLSTIAYCVYVVSTTNILLMKKHYWGFGFVLLAALISLFKWRIGNYIVAITLLLGLINLIAFTPIVKTYSFGFSINNTGIDLKVQLYSFFILLLYIAVNISSIMSFFGVKKR